MNILLARTGGLGDSLLTLPVAHRIKNLYPGAKLHVLGNETMLSVAHLSGIFDEFRSVDSGGFYELYSGSAPSGFLHSFFSQFETVYFFTAAPEKKIISTITRSGARNCRVLNPREPADSGKHIAEHLMTVLGDSHIPESSLYIPEIASGKNDRKERSGCIIHPGSGSLSKTWPIENFVRVAEKVPDQVTCILGPAEIERGLEKELVSCQFPVVIPDSLAELCQILSGASHYIGNDSGVSHLAALCGTPSTVLFGPTNPDVWRPLGRKVLVVFSRDGTMEGISVKEVLDAVISIPSDE